MKSLILALAALLLPQLTPLHAALGLAREAYGVWDREGFHSVTTYPYARGQSLDMSWAAVQTARTTFDWSVLNAQLQFAEDQNQVFTCKVSPIDASAPGKSMPPWMFGPLTASGGGVESVTESGQGAAPYTYGYYLNPQFQVYFEEMVKAFANHLRIEVSPGKQVRIAFVRVDTGATGDEAPYENGSLVPVQYQISTVQWLAYRLWVFEVFRKAFQEGPGPVIPLLFNGVEPPAAQTAWDWINTNVKGGFGIKHGGQLRGYHLSESESNATVYKPLAVDSDFKFFSRNEMDQTWTKPYFQLNVPLTMYWAALEQLNVGMSIWDWNGTCMEGASANGFVFTGEFFNKWAAELDPATAGGGFCVFHEGLDSSDTNRFPAAAYGNASWGNTSRYTAICNAYASQGAKMDDLTGATMGSVAQRDDNPGMIGFNDAGWKIHPGNYDRFITQLNPDGTSKGLWRVRGTLTASSHHYDRFARRSDHASGKDTMYFDINDNLLPSVGQRVQLNVTYLDRGTGQFKLLYDAVGNSQKRAFTVTKTGGDNWVTKSVVVTDWLFGNHGPDGCDLQLVNLATDANNPDTIFHGLEVIKLADVNVGTVGKGTVTGRTDGTIYAPVVGTFMERQRLELTATPAPGWRFTGWTGELSGTNTRPFLFPTKDSRVTANFAFISSSVGLTTSTDNFDSGTWTGGTGWSGSWVTSNTAIPGAIAKLDGTTGPAQITRTLAVALTNATLAFDWDLDRIANSEPGTAEVFNGSWINVWTQTDKGLDSGSTAELVTTNINLSAYGSISKIRFTLNSSTSTRSFYVDNVSVTGIPSLTQTNTQPLFSSDPISKTPATNGETYAGTLAPDASDPGNNPLTFAKFSGPAWLSISANGTLSGTPAASDVGFNSWNVQVSSSGGSDTAILLIDVSAPGLIAPSALTYSSNPANYITAMPITSNTPASSGGAVVAYSIIPPLPTGLILNPTTGVISGTPTAVTPAASYTITATNSAGFTTAALTLTVVSAYTAWAGQNGLVQGPQGDDDGDGNSNYFEFISGLDPTNATSAFSVRIAPVAGQPNQTAITFSPVVIGRTYTVKRSDSLTPGSWTPLSGSTASDVGNQRTVIDTGAAGVKGFYFVEISYP